MTCEQCYVCEQTVLQCSRTMLLAMTYDLCHGGHMVAEYPLLHTPSSVPIFQAGFGLGLSGGQCAPILGFLRPFGGDSWTYCGVRGP